MGYILEKGFDLPPLMLHARRDRRPAVLGAQWVTGHADPRWRARDLMAKVAGTTVPERLRPFVLESRQSRARPGVEPGARPCIDIGADPRPDPARGKQITPSTTSRRREGTSRQLVVQHRFWPILIAVGYHEACADFWQAWCELRQGFPQFPHRPRRRRRVPRRQHPERRDLLRARRRRSLVWGSAERYLMVRRDVPRWA